MVSSRSIAVVLLIVAGVLVCTCIQCKMVKHGSKRATHERKPVSSRTAKQDIARLTTPYSIRSTMLGYN